MSCSLPRSSSARKRTPPKRPTSSFGCRVSFSEPRHLDQHQLTRRGADHALERAEFVDPDQRQAAHAARGRRAQPLAPARPAARAAQESGARLGARHGRRARDRARFLARPCRHDQPHARRRLVLPERQRDLDRHDAAVGEQRVAAQRVIVPASLQAGGQRAAQRRVGGFLEQVHHRLTGHSLLDTEQLEPRRVGIDDDALLHLDDGVVRALQHAVELAARVVRGFERGIERLLRAEGVQLALHHRLQPRLAGEGDHVTGAEREALGDERLVDPGGDQQHRHRRGELVAQRHAPR